MTDLLLFKPKPRKYQQKKTIKVKKTKMINMDLIKNLRAKKKNFVSYIREYPKKVRNFYHDRSLNSPYFYNYTKYSQKDHKNKAIKFSMDHLGIKGIFEKKCQNYYQVLERYSNLKEIIPGYNLITYLKEDNCMW